MRTFLSSPTKLIRHRIKQDIRIAHTGRIRYSTLRQAFRCITQPDLSVLHRHSSRPTSWNFVHHNQQHDHVSLRDETITRWHIRLHRFHRAPLLAPPIRLRGLRSRFRPNLELHLGTLHAELLPAFDSFKTQPDCDTDALARAPNLRWKIRGDKFAIFRF